MKKMLSVLLLFALLLCCAAAEESAAGTWYLRLMSTATGTYPAAAAGASMTLALNDDGSASSTSGAGASASVMTGTWRQNGSALSIILGGKERTGTLSGDSLTLDGSSKLIFGRRALVSTAYIPAAPKSDATIDDYLGLWKCNIAEFNGSKVAVANVGVGMRLDVRGESIVVSLITNGEEEISNYDCHVQDGMLMVGSEAFTVMKLQLLEDGVIVYAEEAEDGKQAPIYYFEVLTLDDF